MRIAILLIKKFISGAKMSTFKVRMSNFKSESKSNVRFSKLKLFADIITRNEINLCEFKKGENARIKNVKH